MADIVIANKNHISIHIFSAYWHNSQSANKFQIFVTLTSNWNGLANIVCVLVYVSRHKEVNITNPISFWLLFDGTAATAADDGTYIYRVRCHLWIHAYESSSVVLFSLSIFISFTIFTISSYKDIKWMARKLWVSMRWYQCAFMYVNLLFELIAYMYSFYLFSSISEVSLP